MKKIAIIDCAIKHPSHPCINRLIDYFERPFHIHWPSLYGLGSLKSSSEADAYIILGSFSNVIDRLEWQSELAEFTFSKLKLNKPVLGICFGHQLMADKLGLKIIKNSNDKKLEGVRDIKVISDELSLKTTNSLNLFKSHSYQIESINDDFIHFLESKECKFDGIKSKSLPFWGVQTHPEASYSFLKNNMESLPLESEIKSASIDGLRVIEGFIKEVESF